MALDGTWGAVSAKRKRAVEDETRRMSLSDAPPSGIHSALNTTELLYQPSLPDPSINMVQALQTQTFDPVLDPSLPSFPPSLAFSPTGVSPAALSVLDEYATNQQFLELQEELRTLLFNSANSVAPSRAASPPLVEPGDVSAERAQVARTQEEDVMKQIITTNGRADYLRNYIDEVAPWVGSL